MKKLITIALTTAILSPTATASHKSSHGYPITPVPFTVVRVSPHTFWGQRLQASRSTTVPLAFTKCESEGRYRNFDHAAQHLKDPSKVFQVNSVGYSFDDTDPYKTIEGAAYLLQTYPDKRLEAYCDSVIGIIAAAQEPDGYLYTARTQNPNAPHHWAGSSRWQKEEDLSHELYNLGHMIESAVAYYKATGKRRFLDMACRYADVACREVGSSAGQACVVSGHQIAEMALARLYLTTGQQRYLNLARFLLDYRGHTTIKTEYSQSHKPVTKQDEAVGHAVRAAYMYAGMADVAALTADTAYINAVDRIWQNIVGKKLYITGGIGATASGEAFGSNYDLPNMSAYCETCAAIGLVYVNHRLFLLHGQSKYYDVLERTLYNGLISGVSLDGGNFFYPNPLESMGQHQRQPWFGCACCPSNICRFIPSLPGYIYAVRDGTATGLTPAVFVNLFLSNRATITVGKHKLQLTQTTNYPWDGDVSINIGQAPSSPLAIKIRIPCWLQGEPVPSDLYHYTDNKRPSYTVNINGEKVTNKLTADGYLTIERRWRKGDSISLHLDMEPRTMRANSLVVANRGMVAIERGPLVYCAEHADNQFDIFSALVNQEPTFHTVSQLLNTGDGRSYPIIALTTDVQTLNFNQQGKLTVGDEALTLIPYYAWCHRGSGKMRLWLPQDLSATTPSQPATLASQSTVTASTTLPALSAVNDRLVPRSRDDRSVPYTHWWPRKATTEWISYKFPQLSEVSTVTVYWFSDKPWGGCDVPKSWRLLYLMPSGQWKPVEPLSPYPLKAGTPCSVSFKPVSTEALRLEVTLPDHDSAGLFEWSVK